MFLLFETAGGFAIFQILKEKKLKRPENLYKEFISAKKSCSFLKLRHYEKFGSMEAALEAASAAVKGNMGKKMKKVLRRLFAEEAHEELAVADAKLGSVINSKLNVACVSNSAIAELMRCIRGHLDYLLEGLPQKELTAMKLGVAHGLSRYKFKFSPDKIDKMIIAAITTLDDLDKEMNNYIMRCKDWYGWHFPELSRVINDNWLYVKTVLAIGFRKNASKVDLSHLLCEADVQKVKDLAEMSMGTEVVQDDIICITNLCKEIIQMKECRAKLCEYLKNRMVAIAPNVTSLVGEFIGARLIARAGSLVNLAKQPASTVQLIGAEKALFRALKLRQNTPKYGVIYHAQLINQSPSNLKGKVSRMLAAKTALACRVDAFGEEESDLGVECRATLERSLKRLEEKKVEWISVTRRSKAKFDRYQNNCEVFQCKSSGNSTEIHRGEPWHKKRCNEASNFIPEKKIKREAVPVNRSNF